MSFTSNAKHMPLIINAISHRPPNAVLLWGVLGTLGHVSEASMFSSTELDAGAVKMLE